MQKFRSMLLRASAERQRRWRLLFALIVVLQVAAVAHLVGHSAAGDNAGCAVCLAASEAGGALPAAAIALPVFHSPTSQVVAQAATPLLAAYAASYRARAPPVSS